MLEGKTRGGGLRGLDCTKGHRRRPGAPRDRGSHVDESTNSAPGTPLGRSGVPDGLPGRLRGAPGGTLERFLGLLGSFGSTFEEDFLIEK